MQTDAEATYNCEDDNRSNDGTDNNSDDMITSTALIAL